MFLHKRKPPEVSQAAENRSQSPDFYRFAGNNIKKGRSIRDLVVQPETARWLRDEILDHRKIVPIDPVEHVVAVDADVVQHTLPRKAHPGPDIYYGISWRWRVTLPKSRLACGEARFDQAHIGAVLKRRPQQTA